jgi:hypothetical protein
VQFGRPHVDRGGRADRPAGGAGGGRVGPRGRCARGRERRAHRPCRLRRLGPPLRGAPGRRLLLRDLGLRRAGAVLRARPLRDGSVPLRRRLRRPGLRQRTAGAAPPPSRVGPARRERDRRLPAVRVQHGPRGHDLRRHPVAAARAHADLARRRDPGRPVLGAASVRGRAFAPAGGRARGGIPRHLRPRGGRPAALRASRDVPQRGHGLHQRDGVRPPRAGGAGW